MHKAADKEGEACQTRSRSTHPRVRGQQCPGIRPQQHASVVALQQNLLAYAPHMFVGSRTWTAKLPTLSAKHHGRAHGESSEGQGDGREHLTADKPYRATVIWHQSRK